MTVVSYIKLFATEWEKTICYLVKNSFLLVYTYYDIFYVFHIILYDTYYIYNNIIIYTCNMRYDILLAT